MCEDLYTDLGISMTERLAYEKVFLVFKRIYEVNGVLEKNEIMDIDDIKRLLDIVSLDNDKMISFIEFQVFYLKGILGS
jgi:hypothetical protein